MNIQCYRKCNNLRCVVQVMSDLVVGRRRRIYYEHFSLTLESEVGSGESAAGGNQSHCLPVLVARIVYCPAPGSTSPSVSSCAVAMKGRRQMPVAVVGEGGSPGTAEVCPTCQVKWSAPWVAGESAKALVCHLRPRKQG